MNMYLKKIMTADEAVQFLRDEGILIGYQMNCEKVADHYQEILDSEELQKTVLTKRERKHLASLSDKQKQERNDLIRSKGLIQWIDGVQYLPSWGWGIPLEELGKAILQSA